MMTARKLSYDEIYSRIFRSKHPETEQTVYYYYLVPFKEKVFFYPIRGFAEALDRGEVEEIILRPDLTDPEKCIMISFKPYDGYIRNRLARKNALEKARRRNKFNGF